MGYLPATLGQNRIAFDREGLERWEGEIAENI